MSLSLGVKMCKKRANGVVLFSKRSAPYFVNQFIYNIVLDIMLAILKSKQTQSKQTKTRTTLILSY